MHGIDKWHASHDLDVGGRCIRSPRDDGLGNERVELLLGNGIEQEPDNVEFFLTPRPCHVANAINGADVDGRSLSERGY